MSSTLQYHRKQLNMDADDMPDLQAIDKIPQVTDEQLVINATKELS